MEKLHLHEGDKLELSETDQGILIKPHRFDVSDLAPLKNKIGKDLPTPDMNSIRHATGVIERAWNFCSDYISS